MYITPKDKNYELIDSGDGMKLERFGDITLLRPEPEALWTPLQKNLWDNADYTYNRIGASKWQKAKNIPESWEINYGGINLGIKPTAFKHTGLFPEQLSNWEYFKKTTNGKKNLKVLNLFGYTGAFSVYALSLGHNVTHVDSSQGVNNWLLDNVRSNNLDKNKIKIITDDVVTFVKRLIKRGEKFDVVVMDPPAFGHGTKASELWKIEEDLPSLINMIGMILEDKPTCVILSGYAAGYSAETYKNLLQPIQNFYGGKIESDVMTIEESGSKRMLTVGIAARWNASA